jgi:hypothetical protein
MVHTMVLLLLAPQVLALQRCKSSILRCINIERFGFALPSAQDILAIDNKSISTVTKVAALSAPLGVLLDNQHGLFGTLDYHTMQVTLSIGDTTLLRTAAWVPFLFSFAGALMSYLILILDKILKTDQTTRQPTWAKVNYGISAFSAQYYLSGLLDSVSVNVGTTPLEINLILSLLAILGFLVFDSSIAGLVLAISTGTSKFKFRFQDQEALSLYCCRLL